VVCGNGFTAGDCRGRQAAVRQALETLGPGLRDWRFIIVPRQVWEQTCSASPLERPVPAFNILALRATYLNSRLAAVFSLPEFDEELARYTLLTGIARLEWVSATG
jgi:hypothetical protein